MVYFVAKQYVVCLFMIYLVVELEKQQRFMSMLQAQMLQQGYGHAQQARQQAYQNQLGLAGATAGL